MNTGSLGHITTGEVESPSSLLGDTYRAMRTLRPALYWLFALPALLGLAAVLSLAGAVVAVRVTGAELPDGDWTWYWFASAWMGAIAFPFFGTLGVVAALSERSRSETAEIPAPNTARSIGLGLLGTLCLVLSVAISGQAYAPVPSILLVVAGGGVYYALWRSQSPPD